MEICSVTLKNFKTHADSHFEFRPGTNAICGENGAGKTSILEAIAWVLFDHSDYTRGELIRTGSKSTQVAVTFVSHLDERIYEARRCTSRGYDLFDPQLNINLGLRKLEDVQAWMREHIGVPPHTDLARLFAETIGIPQGTFTSDFLKRPVERKKIFDPILGVEEYKQAYDQMRDLETYAKAQVSTLTQQLANYEQQLADWDELQQQAAVLKAAIAQDEVQIEGLNQEVLQLQTEVDRLAGVAQQVQMLEAQVRQLEMQRASKTETLQLLEERCLSAQAAVELCRAKRENFQAYEAVQASLQQLSEQRRQQQTALQQREELRQRLRDREGEVSQLQGQLATFAKLRQDLEGWQALVPQQEKLEGQVKQFQERLQALEPIKTQRQTYHTQLTLRQSQIDRLQAEITALESTVSQVEQLPQMEEERQRFQVQLSRLQAGQAFAGELQIIATHAQANGDRHAQQVLTAKRMLSQMLPQNPDLVFVNQVLEAGLVLNGTVLRSLQDLLQALTDSAAIAALEDKLIHLSESIQSMQTLQQQLAVLPLKQQQRTDYQRELKELSQQIETCDRQLTQEASLQAQLAQLETELQQLYDPKGNIRLLQQQLQQGTKIQQQLAQLQAGLTQQQQRITQLDAEIATFAELDVQFEAQQQLLKTHQNDYQEYLRHRNEANVFRTLHPQRAEVQAELAALQLSLQEMQTQLQQTQSTYNSEQLPQLNTSLGQIKQQKDQLQGGLQPKRSQYQDLEQRLQARAEMAEQQVRDRLMLEHKQKVLQFVSDTRHIYNQSGPRITKYYLAEVSLEADKLFRELLNRDEASLEWTEDYDIRVKERGYTRSFRSLSGGEQMCAALAVRLALLRVLAGINVAFFDEPTTNMDRVRRRQLAEAVSNLKAFRQLIVISHDDTFETVTEHVIRIERA
jgi:DNA repair protein SbcC/Rad50